MREVVEKSTRPAPRAWTKPELKSVGTVGQVLAGGGGKTSTAPADPGESRKPQGNANEAK